MKTEKK